MALLAIAAAAFTPVTSAQQPALASQPDWRRIGNSSVELLLAAPATGPVVRVWFSADGKTLYARTRSLRGVPGATFASSNLEDWRPAPDVLQPDLSETPAVTRIPGASSRIVGRGESTFALGDNVYRSNDGGRSWANLTAFASDSIIGSGQHDVAVSPSDPSVLVVANDFGVWRTIDGGLSWTGLNQYLPNLPVKKILAPPAGVSGLRIEVEGIGAAEQQLGAGQEWFPIRDESPAQLEAEAFRVSTVIGATVTALAGTGEIRYAGSSDGRLWVSTSSGRTWSPSEFPAGGPVEAIYADRDEPRIAVAVLGGSGRHVLRTVNTGVIWDDLTGDLPDVPARAVAVDRPAGAIYVATDRGLYLATADLNGLGAASPWVLVSGALPKAPIVDVKLGDGFNQLYVAVRGYGVYATAAPHRRRTLKVVNAADFSDRPAAPGSLLSILGGKVDLVNAGPFRAPVLAVSDTESQIQVPFEVSGSMLPLALQSSGRLTTVGVPLRQVSPAIFIDPEGAPMLLDADSGLLLDARQPARSGTRVQILATGLGRVRPDWPAGLAAPLEQPPAVIAPVTAFLDRTPIQVTRATLAPGYIGFYLIEVQLPALVNAGPAELYIRAGGQDSNRVPLHLEP